MIPIPPAVPCPPVVLLMPCHTHVRRPASRLFAGGNACPFGCEAGCAHVHLRAEVDVGCQPPVVETEHHSLTLPQHAKDRSLQCVGSKVVIKQVTVAHDRALPGARVIGLDDPLLGETVHGPAPLVAVPRLRCVHEDYRSPLLSHESEWLSELARRLPEPPSGQVWVGDDAAVVPAPDGWLLSAADTLVEGVHADLRLTTAADMGWKALAVNLSDLAAMGGRPLHALVTVVVPRGRGGDLDELYEGLEEAARAFGCPIVGGDLSVGPTLVVTVAVTGTVDDGGPAPVLRRGAAPGHLLFVTGPLGAAAAGLRGLREREGSREREGNAAGQAVSAEAPNDSTHRRPSPRMAQGSAARRAGASAMIDLSDGLAMDLRRLGDASGVGVVLDEVPIAPGATRAEAILGGDDYELLIATPDADRLQEGFRSAGVAPALPIGICTDRVGEYRLGDQELPTGGWDHQW